MLPNSCSDDGEDTTPIETIVNPSDANALAQVLVIPNATRTTGTVPVTSTEPTRPTISNNVSTVVSSNGSTIPLTFTYSNVNGNLGGYYVQVVGANSYFTIPNATATGESGQIQIPITIPANVIAGTFSLSSCVFDTNGEVSNVLTTTFNNLALGTGALQVSLSWNTETDMDLYVTDPSGEVIYYGDEYAESGGQLDRDDTDGYGPENIFWDDNAPNGTYIVEVHDYDGSSLLQNWVVTVTSGSSSRTFSGTLQNGQRKTVTTFTKNGTSLSF
jgi:hypothetical protein